MYPPSSLPLHRPAWLISRSSVSLPPGSPWPLSRASSFLPSSSSSYSLDLLRYARFRCVHLPYSRNGIQGFPAQLAGQHRLRQTRISDIPPRLQSEYPPESASPVL